MSRPGPGIEILRPPAGQRFRFVLFDFDGTISLIRRGWQDVMIPVMLEKLTPLAPETPPEEIEALVSADIDETNGLPTIYQMMRLADRVREFGGEPDDPARYKAEYVERLLAHIADRRRGLADGSIEPARMLLPGARELLDDLAGRDLLLCLASGTDEQYVREEAELLGVAGHFGEHVYGAREDYVSSSKRKVIERLIAANDVAGPELLTFGDGFVEIENCKEVGGYAVGVASDEEGTPTAAGGGGEVNAWKRDRLIKADADMIVADFARHRELVAALFGERE